MFNVTSKASKVSVSLSFATLITLAVWISPQRALAHQEPPGCSGNGSGGNIGIINGAFHHVGDAIDFTVGLNVPAGQCQGSNITARLRFPDNNFIDYATNLTLNPGTGITCPNVADPRCLPGPYRYIVRQEDLGKSTVETNLPNVDCRSPAASNSVYAVATASGVDHTGPGSLESSFSDCRNIPITVFVPRIACTKLCNNAIGQNGQITFSGSVSNSGIATPLAPVTVSNLVNGVLVLVTNITQLNPGQVITFSGSYTPANPCLPTTDTIFVGGTDPLGSNVTSQCSATCSNIFTPCISVTKNCDGPIVVGGTQTISGVVSNCGNIALTNVVLTDNVIGAVTNIANLPIGGSVAYSKTFTATCNANTNTVTAIGTTICGQNVTNSATAICPVTSTPCIFVTKDCTTNVVGSSQTISGVVSNCGNITLTNIIVNDNIAGAVTNIASLAPGAFTTYSKSFTAVCGGNVNTVTAIGTSTCGQNVTNSATATCRVTEAPCIAVTKLCTGPVVVGASQTISGVISNCGNVTLTNVVLTDNILGAVTNIATLPVGGTLAYTKSFTATCNANTNTVTATANSICGTPVQASATAPCPVTSTPCIFVTKDCTTNLVGTSQTISGVVSNCGNITLTNIIVSDNIADGITNIASLAPGAFTTYSKSFTAVCGGNVNTVTAIGTSTCGQNVTNSATATCRVTEAPCIAVTKLCTGPVVVGASQTISGVISNCGNVTLTNVVLTDNILGAVTNIATLPVGGTLAYTKSFTATCNANTNTVTATANSICGTPVQASATAPCPVTSTPCIFVTKDCTTNLVGTSQTISGVVSNCGNITLTNIIVSDNIADGITNIASLAPGAFTTYSKSFTAVCGGNVNTVTAIGTSTCGQNVTNSATATCRVTEAPCIAVTKLCPGPAVVGTSQSISGVVSNCGNVTLTNIVVTDNVLGAVTNIATLPVGGTLAYTKSFTATCAGNTNTVTATANSICGTAVQASATATCLSTHTPCIAVTKNCSPSLVEAGQTVTFSGVVSNCGNITLTNVVVRDSFLNANVAVLGSLAAGASAPYTTNYVTTAADCGKTFTNTVVATGTDLCLDHSVTNTASCTFRVDCPKICIIKEVACFIGTNAQGAEICDTFSKLATGVQGDTQDPAFCYRITVTNCGLVSLTNVTVIDDKYGNLTTHFFANPSVVFPAGGSVTFTFKAALDGASLPNHISVITNTVVTTGQSTTSGQTVNAQDKAVARVIPAGVSCEQLYTVDNGALTNCVKLNLADTATHVVVTYIRLVNTGVADLSNLRVTNDVANPCRVDRLITSLTSGSTVLVALCTNAAYTCDSTDSTITVTVTNFSLTNVAQLCAHDINGKVIVVRSECPGCVECTVPNACRTTGGGRQDDPLVYPHDVRYVTHGGQVGAPVGNRVCTVTTNFVIGNPCIHGRWTHVRHVKGGLEGNFHARFYDTLDCACLDTDVTSVVTNVPGVNGNPSQTYVNLVYGPGTVINGLCNPDDHKVAGPEPRPAPANKIVFTGVGDWADPNGRRSSRATLFRVDIEDRSEPGGSHPKGGTAPPDRYRIRIWVLSDSELAQLNGSGPDRWLLNFRNAISACNGLNVQDGASVVNGTAVFGVRRPDIDDGGELERGNHQIHPAIKNCDPFDPTGPGLANP